jgi:hypothetical protein
MTELVQIRTVDELRNFMQVVEDSRGNGLTIEDKELCWFVCIQEAEMVSDSYRLKDIALLFRDGLVAINTLEQVQDHLDNIFCEGEEAYHEDNNKYLLAAVYRYFGMHDQANELLGEDEEDLTDLEEDC